MKTRVMSGLIMVPLLLVIYFGGIWLWIAALLISVIGLQEFCNGFEALGVHPAKRLSQALACGLFGALVPEVISGPWDIGKVSLILMFWTFVAVAAAMMYGWKITERGTYDAVATVTALVYIPFFAAHIVLLDLTPFRILTWVIVLAAFGSDIFAYFTGYFLGKHKMSPNLSPKKTVEGAIGGLIGSTAACAIFGLLFLKDHVALCAVLGLVGGAAGMAGDLTASMFKRKMGIKDYGTLIPGHGGIMDRFDSVLFAAPVIYYITVFYSMIQA